MWGAVFLIFVGGVLAGVVMTMNCDKKGDYSRRGETEVKYNGLNQNSELSIKELIKLIEADLYLGFVNADDKIIKTDKKLESGKVFEVKNTYSEKLHPVIVTEDCVVIVESKGIIINEGDVFNLDLRA